MKYNNSFVLLLVSFLIQGCNVTNESFSENHSSESEIIESSEDNIDMKEHKKSNYHTHTYRCNHATGEDKQYVESAINNGYDLLGFTDHVMLPYTLQENSVRATYDKIDD